MTQEDKTSSINHPSIHPRVPHPEQKKKVRLEGEREREGKRERSREDMFDLFPPPS